MSEPQKIEQRPTEAQRKNGPIDVAEVFAIAGFALLVVGLVLLAGAAVAMLVAGAILFGLGLVMAWLRSR
jgi:hypothetical protein